MDDFDLNVFVNCPFDEKYRPLLISIIFTLKYLGLKPRLSLEREDSGESRMEKIMELIIQSKYGIHDLSRMVSKSADEPYRMNMPFELGIDFGCQKLKEGIWQQKKLLIMDTERFRFQAALSDMAGRDIKAHEDDYVKVVKVVRNWFNSMLEGIQPSPNVILKNYHSFDSFLTDKLVAEQSHDSVDDVEVVEILQFMDIWFKRRIKIKSP